MFDSLVRRQSVLVLNRFLPVFQKYTHTHSSLVKSEPRIKALVEEDRVRSKVPFEKHFIENLFLNNFQPRVLEYPEINSLLEFKSLFRHKKYAEELINKVDEKDVEYECENDRIASKLKNFELSGFKLPKKMNGFGFLDSEYYFLLETICSDIPLGKVVSENEDCINLIQKFGNNKQKETYIQKLALGQSIACFAHLESEPFVSLNPVSVTTTAMPTSDNETYIVTGKKDWVHNADLADVLIFSANVPCESGKPKPTIFLIDKNTKGVIVRRHNEYLDKFDVCEVVFDNVAIPSDSVLGEVYGGDKIIKKLLISGKMHNGVQCLTLMKNLLHLSMKHCIQNKLFNKSLYERDYFKKKIGKMVCDTYVVESMTYLVAGRLDSFEDPDVFLESLIVKVYASEVLQSILKDTLGIIGSKIFEDEELESYIKNVMKSIQMYAGSDDTNDYLKLVLSTRGINYVNDYYSSGKIFKKIGGKLSKKNVKVAVNKYLMDEIIESANYLKSYVHLMFQPESGFLESLVLNLERTTNLLIKNFKDSIFNHHMELKLLADLVMYIYAVTATLGRASRAYCLGVQGQEIDNYICHYQIPNLHFKFMEIKKTIEKLTLNEQCKKVGSELIGSKNYAERHSVIANLIVRN